MTVKEGEGISIENWSKSEREGAYYPRNALGYLNEKYINSYLERQREVQTAGLFQGNKGVK